MDDFEEQELRQDLFRLKQEHRDLDDAIAALHSNAAAPDQLQLRRLKKKKLRLRDNIINIEDDLFPDIIA